MNAKQLIKKLQELPSNMEIVLAPGDVESVAQIGTAQVRRIYDLDGKNGERRVFLLEMKDYGHDEYELIMTPN